MVELRDRDAWWVAGSFAIFSSLLTLYQVRKHLQWNNQKSLRKYIIRILFMVPIYGLESWLGLRFVHEAMYFDVLRECYEAFVIYSFYQLLLTYLGGEYKLILILANKPQAKHMFPFCCLPQWPMSDFRSDRAEAQEIERELELEEAKQNQKSATSGSADNESAVIRLDAEALSSSSPSASSSSSSTSSTRFVVHRGPLHTETAAHSYSSQFLLFTQIGTLQYCVLRPVTAVLAFLFELVGVYEEGEFRWDAAYPYLSFIVNCSQIWAMYCLVLFYYALKDELKGLKPVPKFIVVKAVVFFTFWQFVLLSVLAKLGILHETENYTEDRLTAALQDFIVCIEMCFAAAAHHAAFNYEQFHDSSAPQIVAPMFRSMFEAIDVTDVYVDEVKRLKEKAFRKSGGKSQGALNAPLLDNQLGVSDGRNSNAPGSAIPSQSNNSVLDDL